ncbi:MAG: hypothetical protein KF800_07585 [Lysobacter sp.]|nr:hypothetical protein [Lysobacter sp.]
MNMVRLATLISALVMGCSASAANIRLDNESLKGDYRRDRPVSFLVQNQDNKTVKIYSNAEIFDGGEWVAWPYGIENGIPEAISTIHAVKPGQEISLTLDFSKVEPPPIPSGERPSCNREPLFRFRVVVMGQGEDKQEMHSTAFKVTDPYGICAEDGRVSP